MKRVKNIHIEETGTKGSMQVNLIYVSHSRCQRALRVLPDGYSTVQAS